ncbi:PAS domain S-box-containing protein [Azospirillum brasilense]|uniref:histidine kinase n=1 Tax=Azospirillum brasilense TaxID=192 RepID=A0A560B007_AZOBR|nr:ATP-binding protein [Azospirillum brasilense]TWA65957.1 PAS domain S-box-containing protein [Azospirillum brasilense]
MAAAGLARFDADGRLIWANAVFRASLGGRPGDRLDCLLAALPACRDAAAADRLRAGRPVVLAASPGGGRSTLVPAEGEGGELVLTLVDDGALAVPPDETGFIGLEDLLGDRAGVAERAIMQAIAVPLVVTRLSDGLVMAVNQPAGLLFGVPLDAVVGRSFASDYYTDPAERERLLTALRDGAGSVDGFETRLCRPDGSDLWAMVSARRFRFRGESAMLACISDISARKRTEQALEAQWDQTRAVLNGLGQGVMAFDRALRLVAWNGRVTELLGLEPEALGYHTPYAAIARRVAQGLAFGPGSVCPTAVPNDQPIAGAGAGAGAGASAALGVPLPARPAPDDRAWECTRSDGQVLECLIRPLPDGGFVVTYTDVTERRNAEREIIASRELFELAIRAAREGISQWDLRTGQLWLSPYWWGMLGYGEDEMVNTAARWTELILPEDRELSVHMARDLVNGVMSECQFIQRFRHKRGTVVHMLTRAIRVLGPDGALFRIVGSHTDVTDRVHAEERVHAAREEAERALRDLKEAQAHLIQSEKMAALGSLVAGVAHEINTPIGIALTGASLVAERTRLIRRDFEAGTLRRPDFADFLEMAGEAAQLMLLNIDRAAQLIQSFKQIAVDQASEERRVFDLRDYIDEVLRSLGVRIKRAAHGVEVDCPADLLIDGYPGALSQVLTNLVMNSIIHGYAPGQHGTLRVTARAVGADEVELVYADDGRGIPAELHGKVFEPFFTTSRGAGGSGLGLNIVYNIATRKLRGRIALDSAPGRGTTFTLRFPRVAPAERVPA